MDSTTADTLYQLDSLDANTKFFWRITALNSSDTGSYSTIANFTTGDQILSVQNTKIVPVKFKLSQNYPNPFNPSTVIKYSIAKAGLVKINVYNVLGEKVETIVNREQAPGTYQVRFNASSLASGIYIYRLEEGNFTSVRKMILIK